MNIKKNLYWNILFSYGPIAISIVSGFFFLPIYLDRISPAVYGLWLATGNVFSLFTIIDPGFNLILQQSIAKSFGENDIESASKSITAGLVLAFIVLIFILAIGFLYLFLYAPKSIDVISSDQSTLLSALYLALIGTSLSLFSYTLSSINQGLLNSFFVGFTYIIASLLSLVLCYTMLVNNKGILSLAYMSFTLGGLLIMGNALILYFSARRLKISIIFEWKILYNILSETMHLFVSRVVLTVSQNIDLIIIAKYFTTTEVTIISISRKLPDIFKSIIERPIISSMPTIGFAKSKFLNNEVYKIVVKKLVFIVFWTTTFIYILIINFNDFFIKKWVGGIFSIEKTYILVVSIGIILQLIVSTVIYLINATGSGFKQTSRITLAQSTLSILLMYILPKSFGLWGVFLSPLISIIIIIPWLYTTFSKFFLIDLNYARAISKEFFLSLTFFTCINFLLEVKGPLLQWTEVILYTIIIFLLFLLFFITLSREFRVLFLKIIKSNDIKEYLFK